MKNGRRQVLDEAESAVMSDRNADYAPPEVNFQRIADLWNVYLDGRTEVTPYDTAIMMILVKVARVQASPHILDHLVDIAGYAACAGDVLPAKPEPVIGGLVYDDPIRERATYENAPGFIQDEVWYGDGGRKVGIVNRAASIAAGVLVMER